MQATLSFLRKCGHEPRVLVDEGPRGSYDFGGIEVIVDPGRRLERALYSSADIILGQGINSVRSFMRAAEANRPYVLFVRDVGDWRKMPRRPDLVVFNAEWQVHMSEYLGAALVVHPPMDVAKYLCAPGDRVTLINLNRRKGGDLFGRLVKSMPDVQFLGVIGMWGEQIVPRPLPRNLEILESQNDVRRVYSRTRVLLLPSRWESFGRVAVEAALSGIPVVASPNPGTIEALGNAAIYASLSDVDEWVAAIRSLDDPEFYSSQSVAIAHAAERFTGANELVDLEEMLKGLAT